MLKVDSIVFSYADKSVLKEVSFELEKGKHLAVMGESGSGKSTLLKAIYGLLHLNSGGISWGNQNVLGPNYNLVPGEKYMKYVAQDFDLMPFTTVSENIAEHLSAFEQETHEARILELLRVIAMEDYAKTKVKSLSGGQQQRVALARALAQEPELLLLDEPFSSIDQFKKNELRYNLFPYLKEKGITVINATHDPNDVLAFADTVLVLQQGKTLALKPTEQLYRNPKNTYVASLFDIVNKLPLHLFMENAAKDEFILAYPHDIHIVKENGFEAYAINTHFKGHYYLAEGLTEDGTTVFFTTKQAVKIHKKILLGVSPVLLKTRKSSS